MRRIRLFFYLSFFLSLSAQLFAQRPEVGLNVGAAGYIGEYNPDKVFKPSGLNFGLFGRLNLDPRWSLGMHVNYGNIQGDASAFPAGTFRTPDFSGSTQRVQDGLNFNTKLYEAAAIAQFNFFDMYSPGKKKRWTPFIFAGLGGLLISPTVELNGIEQTKTSSYLKDRMYNYVGIVDKKKDLAIVIPFGAGIKLKQSDAITWQGSFGYRHLRNEYLDVYTDKLSYVSDSGLSESRKRDAYLFVNIGISYTFVSPKCFTF